MEEDKLDLAIDEKVKETKFEFSSLQQEIINSLKLPKGYTVLSVSDKIDTIPLGGTIEAHDVYAVKVQDKSHKIETLLVDKDLKQLASVKENNKVVLSDLTKDRFEEQIGKQGRQTPRTKRIL